MLPKQIGILLALGTLIAACGVPTTRTNFVDDYEVIATEIGRGDCYVIPGVDEWTVIDDHHVYIKASKSALERESGADSAEGPVVVSTVESRMEPEVELEREFLISTKSMCRGFIYSPVIKFPRSRGLVCQNESRIGYSFSEHPRTCAIDNIEVVESRSAAIALVSSRSRVEEGSLIDFILRRESAVIEDVP